MGNFLRRVVAFLLGIVFTITSLVGGVVGGAYYAYKNVHPLESAGSEFGDLQDATIEELVDLIANGMNPDTYGDFTLERLMEEYGLDLATILSDKLGLDLSDVDTESKDWKALTSLSLSSLLTGDFDELLNSIKLRSLFVLAPAVLGAPIDDFLSPEAQSALGDYTISELIGTVDGGSNELGIVHALKNLKIGSLLPEIFDYEYDVNTHEYIYSVKQDGALKNFAFLDLVGNVPFKGIFNIVEGKDVMTELFEGEFKSLTSMKIVDVLNSFGKVAGDDIYGVISQYTQIFGDVTIADLFAKNNEGVYEFALENLLGGLQFGYLAGLTKNEDGEWVDSEGNAPTGLIAFIASISLKGVMNSDGDVIAMINDTIGDLSLMSIIETVYPRDSYPVFLERLGTIKVSSILCDGADGILSNLKLSFKVALRGMTVGDAVDMVLDLIGDDGSLKANIESIEIAKALMTIEVNEFIRDVYTAKDIIRVFDNAIGDLTVGKAFGLTSTGNALDLLYDYELGNIFDGVIAILDGAKASEIVGAFVGQYTFGDVFGAITGYEYSDVKDNWGKDGKYVGEGLVTLLKTSVAEFAKTFDKDSGYDVTEVVGGIQLADVIYTVLQLVGIDDILVEDRDGDFVTYVAGGDFADFAPLSKVILTITVNDLMKNVTSGEYWLDRAEKIALGDLTAYVVNHFLGEDINFTYGNGKWTVDSEYLTALLSNSVNVTIGRIISAVQNGTVLDLIVDVVGDTSIGDVTYAVLGIAGIDGIIEKASNAYQMAGELSDFNKFAQSVFGLSVTDIIENVSDVDWWFEKLGDVRIGDLVAYFINKYAPEMSATDGADGWTVTGTLGSLLSGLFNVTFNQLRDVSNTFIRDAFGFLSIGDVVETFVPEEYLSMTFVQAITAVTVNDIIDIVQCQTMEQVVDKLQYIFDGVGVGDLVDVFADVSNYEYGVFERVLNTDFDFVFGILISNDVFNDVVTEYGEISVGEVAYTILKTMGIEDVVVPAIAVNDNAKLRAVAKASVGGYTLSSDYADFAPLADKLLSIDFEEVASNLNGEYWLDRAGSISVGDVSAYVINQLIGVEGLSLTHNGSTWTVNSDYLEELLENVFNFTVSDVTDIIDGNTDVTTVVTDILGNTSVGDIVYAGLGFAGIKDVITETSSGYAIPSDYEELDNLAQAILKLEIAGIVENAADVDFWLDNFDAITVGDLVDILLSDELENNEFISVVRGISVNDVRGWVESDANGVASDLEKAFAGVKLQHLVNVFYSDAIGIDVVERLLDTDVDFLFSLVNSDNAIDDIFKEYSDIDLDLVLGQYIESVIDTENAFVASTLSFGVADVYNVWLGESVVDVVLDLYNKVTIGDAVNAIYDTTGLAYDPANTVLELKINDVINAFVEEEIVEFLIDTFGEVTIGDVILPRNLHITMFGHEISFDRGWIVNGELGELLTNIFNVNLNDILDNVENQNHLRANLLELVGETNIGNAGNLIYANDLQIGALKTIYEIPLSDIVNEVFDGTVLQYLLNDVLFEITVDDLIGFALPASVRANRFVSATFAIKTNTVLDILDNDTAEDILMAVSDLYDGVTLGNIIQLFGIEEAPISVLQPIFKAKLDGLIASIAKNEVLDYVMIDVIGGITIDNVITDIESLTNTVILGDLRENNLIGDVLNVSVGGVYEAIIGENVLYDIGAMFIGSTIGDIVKIFTEIPEFEALQTLCTISIGKTLQGIANNDLTALTDTLVDAYNQLPEAVQYGIIAGVGVTGVILYFVSNSTLLDIIDLMLGKGATWGDLLGKALGYSFIENKYVSDLGYNSLMGIMLGSTITETLTTGYPLLNNVKDHVTLGNLLTAYPAAALWIEESIGMDFAEVDGKWTLDNEFTDLAENLFNVSLGNFLTADNKFITADQASALMHDTFDGNDLGDVLAYFINRLGEEPVVEKENGEWTVDGLVLDEVITNVLNITFGGIYKAINAEDKTPYVEKAKALFGDTNVGALVYDVAGLVGDSVIVDGETVSGYALKEELEDFNELAQIVFAIRLVDIVDNITDGEYWLNIVKPVQLGYLVNYFLPEEIENNNFIATTLSVSVNDVIAWTHSDNGITGVVESLEDKYAGVMVSDVVALFTDSTIENAALLKLVNVGISDLLDLIICDSPEDSVLALIGDINVGDVFGLVPVYSTAFERETFAISVNDIYTLVRGLIDGNGLNSVVSTLNSVYETSSVGSIVYSFGVQEIKNEALVKLAGIQLSDLANLITSATPVEDVRTLVGGITLGDAIGQYLGVRDNAFLNATYAFSVNALIDIITAETADDAVKTITDLYVDITVGDVFLMIDALADTSLAETTNEAIQKLYAIELLEIVEAVKSEEKADALVGLVGDVSVGDAFGLEPVYSTAFERETFAIDVEDIYGLVKGLIDGNGINAVVDTFDAIYQTSSVGSVVYSFGVKSIDNQALIKLFKIQLSELADLAVSKDVLASVRNLLKDITLGDAISQYLKVDNDFVDATLGFGFETVFKILEANDVADFINIVKGLYEGITLGDIVSLAIDLSRINDALDKILDSEINSIIDIFFAEDVIGEIGKVYGGITIGDAIGDVLEGAGVDIDNKFLSGTLSFGVQEVLDLITDGDVLAILFRLYEEVTVYNVVELFTTPPTPSNVTTTVYELNLYDIIESIANRRFFEYLVEELEEVVLGDVVFNKDQEIEIFGYAISYRSGSWVASSADGNLDAVITNLLNVNLGDIVDTAEGKTKFVDQLLEIVGDTTIREIGEKIYKNESGIGVVEKLYNVKLYDIINSANKNTLLTYVKDFACDITVYDVLGFLISDAEIRNNAFVKASLSVSGNTIINIVDAGNAGGASAILNEIADLYTGVEFKDVTALAGLNESPLEILNTVFDAGIDELLRAISDEKVSDYLLSIVDPISIGNLVADIEKLTDTTTALSGDNGFFTALRAINVKAVREAIVSDSPVDDVCAMFEGVIVGDVVRIFTSNDVTNEALVKLTNIYLSDLIALIGSTDVENDLVEMLGNISIGDVFGLVPVYNTVFERETYGIDVEDIYGLVKGLINNPSVETVVETFNGIYKQSDILSIIYSFGLEEPSNNALAKLTDIKLSDLANLIVSTDSLESFRTMVGDITLGDAVSQYVGIRNNAFLDATYAISVNAIIDIVVLSDTSKAIDAILNLYDGVVVRDIFSMIDELAETSLAENDNGAIQKLYAIELLAILDAVKSDDKIGELVGLIDDITVSDISGLEPVYNTVFERETYGISVEDVYTLVQGLVDGNGINAVVGTFNGIYKQSDILSIIYSFGLEEPSNEALAKLTDIKLSDLANLIVSGDPLSSIRTMLGDITLGDAVSELVNVEGNAFLNATYKFSVDHIFDIIEAEGLGNKLKVITNLYADVTVLDVVETVDVLTGTSLSTIANEAVQKVYALELLDILGVVKADDKAGELVKLVGDVTVGNVISKEPTRNTTFMQETFAISVSDVYDLAKAIVGGKGVSGIIEVFNSIYAESTINGVLGSFGLTTPTNPALVKLVGIKLSDIASIAVSNQRKNDIRALVGDITLGDCVSEFVKVEGNAFLEATYKFSVGNIFDIIEAEGLGNKLKVITNLYADVTVLDVVETVDALTGTSFGTIANEAVQKVYALELLDILGVVKADDKAGELVKLIGDITVGNVISKEPTRNTTFMQETFAVSVSDVYDLAKAIVGGKGVSGIVEIFNSIYVESTINGVLSSFGLSTPTNPALAKLVGIKLSDIASIAVSNQRKNDIRALIGDITLGDAFSGIIGKIVDGNNVFVQETLGLSVEHVFKVLDNLSVGNAVKVVASLYTNSTLEDVVKVVLTSFSTTRASINTALGLNIGEAMIAVSERNYAYFTDYAKSIYNATTRNEKLILVGVAGVGAGALYFINNDLLVKLVDKALGEGATFGDILAGVFGYELVDGEYKISGLSNGLMNTFLSEEISTFLTKGYPFFGKFRSEITLGNLLTVHSKIVDAFANRSLPLAIDTDGKLMVSGYLANISKSILSLGLGDVITAEKQFVGTSGIKALVSERFGSNTLGDIIAIVVNNQDIVNITAEYSKTASQWVVTGKGASILNRVFNVTFSEVYRLVKNRDLSALSDLIGDTTLLNLATAVRPSLADNKTAALVLSIKVKDVINVVRGNLSVKDLVGDWTLGELAGDYLPDRINKDSAFAQVFLNLTLSDVYAISKDPLGEAINRFGDFTFGEVLGFVGYDASSSTDELVKTILDLKLNIFSGGLNAGIDEIMNTVKSKELGLILGYTKGEDGYWYSGSQKLTGILATVAGKSINEISDPDFFDSLTLGEALGYTYNAEEDKWYDSDGEPVTGVMGAFAGKTIGQISNDPNGAVNDVVLGEALGYTKETDATTGKVTWKDSTGNPVTGVMGAFAGKTIGQISDDPTSAINTVVLGEALGYTKGTDDKWYSDSACTKPVTGALATLADKTIGSISEDPDFINNMKLGEALGYTKETDATTGKVTWKDSTGNPVTGVMAAFVDKTIGEISNDPNSIVNTVVLGEALGYTRDTDGKWYTKDAEGNDVPVTGALAILADKTIGALSGNPDFINDLYLGEVLGYTKETDAEGNVIWKDSDHHAADGILSAFVGLQIKDLNDNDKLKTQVENLKLKDVIEVESAHPILKALGDSKIGELSASIESIQLGTALGYTKGTDGKWYSDSACTKPVTGVMSVLSDKSISQMSDAENIIKGIELGTALGYTKDADGNWSNGSDAVTGIMKSFVGVKIGDLNDTKMKEIVNGLTLGDVVDTSGNTILSALSGVTIGSLSDEINEMNLGTIMGYTKKTDGKWYTKEGDHDVLVTDGLATKIAEWTVSDIATNGITADQFVVSDVFSTTGDSKTDALIEFIGEGTKLSEIPTTITANFETITVGTAINLGIFGDFFDDDPDRTDDNYDKINSIFKYKYITSGGDVTQYTDAVWKDMEFVDFMQAIFDMITIPSIPGI